MSACGSAAQDATVVFTADMTDEYAPSIGRVSGGDVERLLSAPAAAPVEAAVDPATGTLYWINGLRRVEVGRTIARGSAEEPAETILRDKTADVDAFADLAIYDGALYVLDYDTKFSRTPPRIVRTGLGGGDVTTLVEDGLDDPKALAVGAGGMVWSDGSRVMRAALDGGEAKELFTSEEGSVRDVAFDGTTGALYWIESSYPEARIWTLGPDADAPTVTVDGAKTSDLGRPTDLAAHGGRLYWIVPGMFEGGDLLQANADGSDLTTLTPATPPTNPTDILATDGAVYIVDQDRNNVLRLTPEDTSGQEILAPRLVTAADVALHSASGHMFWADPIHGLGRARSDGTSPEPWLPQAAGANSLAIDQERGLIYWAVMEQGIFRATVEGDNVTTVVRSTDARRVEPLYMALDASNSMVYWMDRTGEVVRVPADGGEPEAVAVDVGNPGPLAVDTTNGTLYWADLGDSFDDVPAQIIRADLDGQNATPLPPTATTFLADLEVDPVAGTLYWNDTNLGTITRADLDGRNEQVLTRSLPMVKGLSVQR